jgi:hypothetical protein
MMTHPVWTAFRKAADADPVVRQDDDRTCLQVVRDRRKVGEDRGRLLGCPTANEPPDQQNRRELGTASG